MKHKRKTTCVVVVAVLFSIISPGHAIEMSSDNYTIATDVLAGGGGRGNSTNYSNNASIAQALSTGVSSNSNYSNYAGYIYMINSMAYKNGAGQKYLVSGSAYNIPKLPFRASLALDVKGSDLSASRLVYRYSGARLTFRSTYIASSKVTGDTAEITGTGKVNNLPGYTFTATVSANPVEMGIDIYKPEPEGGDLYFSAETKPVIKGSFNIKPE